MAHLDGPSGHETAGNHHCHEDEPTPLLDAEPLHRERKEGQTRGVAPTEQNGSSSSYRDASERCEDERAEECSEDEQESPPLEQVPCPPWPLVELKVRQILVLLLLLLLPRLLFIYARGPVVSPFLFLCKTRSQIETFTPI